MKHTKGPWKYDDELYIWGPNNEMIAEMRGTGANLPQEANARLIAAAPDMLTLLDVAFCDARDPEAYMKENWSTFRAEFLRILKGIQK